MPVEKGKQKIYGRIVGKMINSGHSVETAKNIADRAVQHKDVSDKQLKTVDNSVDSKSKCKGCGKVHSNGQGYH